LVRLIANTFSELVKTNGLINHIEKVQTAHPSKKITYLIEGLGDYVRNNKRLVTTHSGYKSTEKYLDKEKGLTRRSLDEALIWLQVEGRCQVWETDNPTESAEYVIRIANALAQLPYRPESSFDSFCAEATVKRSAKNVSEAWVNQLMQIHGVSEEIALSIVGFYPTIRSLFELYTGTLSDTEKRELLKDITVLRSDQNPSNRKVGKSISEKIYRIFTSEDGKQILH